MPIEDQLRVAIRQKILRLSRAHARFAHELGVSRPIG
jgi:hypothetical protein